MAAVAPGPGGMTIDQIMAMLQSQGGGPQVSAPALGAPQQANGTLTQAPTVPGTAYASNPMLPTSDYTAQVTNALQPQFTQQNQSLTQQLEGEGILNSGAASKQLQDLTGEQSAAISSAVAPLLAQGNAEASQTNLQNAAAKNNTNALGYSGGLSTYQLGQQLGNTNALANQNTQTTYDLANLGALNSTQLAQMGYSNQDYLTMLQDIYGIDTSGQAAGNSVDIGSVATGANAYLNGQNSVTNSAGGIGAGTVGGPTSVYGTGTGAGVGAPSYNFGGSPDTSGRGTGGDDTAVNGDNFFY